MSEENVAIVKSSWAGWRQGLDEQMARDFEPGVGERIAEWADANEQPSLQPEEFFDGGDVVLVQATDVDQGRALWFAYTLQGPRIAGWDVYEDEGEARAAAGL